MDAKIPALKVQVSNALNWDHLEGCVFGEAATKSNPKETKTNCSTFLKGSNFRTGPRCFQLRLKG